MIYFDNSSKYQLRPPSAAALATACKAEYDYSGVPLNEVKQNKALGRPYLSFKLTQPIADDLYNAGDEFAHVFSSKYGTIDYVYGIANASTDFVRFTFFCNISSL